MSAIPGFIPVIGTGANAFTDIGAQQMGWQNFNRGIEENNLARARQAEQERNNYLAQMAQWQRQDQERASQDQERELAREAAAQAAMEKRREFDIGTGLSEKEIAARKDQYQWHNDIRDADQKRQMATVENTAKFLAKDAADYADRFKDTVKELRDATSALDTSAAGLNPSGSLLYKNKQFVPQQMANTPENQKAAAEANAKLAEDKARYDQAVQNYQLSLSNWNELRKRAATSGLELSEDGTIYSPFHDKTFGTKLKVPAPEAPQSVATGQLPSWLTPYDMSGMGGGSGDAMGLGSGAATIPAAPSWALPDSQPQQYSPPPPPQAMTPLKIGRFTVTM